MTAKRLLFGCLAGVTLSVLTSCSIKEDRSVCPCRLILDMSGTEGYTPVKVNVIASDGSTFSAVYDPSQDGGEGQSVSELIFKIPKGVAMVAAVAGDDGRFRDFSGMNIPLGDECPYVFMHAASADASGETCRQTVSLDKNYCRISVQMADDSRSDYPFKVAVVGNIDGYSFPMTPEEGDFRYVMQQDDEGVFHVNVPRQKGTSLLLRVQDGNQILRDFAIGEYLEAGGYDWTAENLEDVELYIDYAKADLVFKVADWEFSFSFDVVI